MIGTTTKTRAGEARRKSKSEVVAQSQAERAGSDLDKANGKYDRVYPLPMWRTTIAEAPQKLRRHPPAQPLLTPAHPVQHLPEPANAPTPNPKTLPTCPTVHVTHTQDQGHPYVF